MPALMAWNRNTECIASRTFSLPRKEKEKLETPPEICACGFSRRMTSHASTKALPYSLCSSRPVATAKILGSKMISSGGKPSFSTSRHRRGLQISILRSLVSAWPASSNAITTTAAPKRMTSRACSRNGSSPSFSEMELTIDLALAAFQSRLDHVPFGAVDHQRHLGDVGLARHHIDEAGHRRLAVDHALVHIDVDDLGAVLDLLAGHLQRGFIIVG